MEGEGGVDGRRSSEGGIGDPRRDVARDRGGVLCAYKGEGS